MKTDNIVLAFKKGYRVQDNNVINLKTNRIIKAVLNRGVNQSFYPYFNIKVKSKTKHILCHQLAAFQKYGPVLYARAMVVRHEDDNAVNFSLSNILLGTQSENIKDCIYRKRNNPLRRKQQIRFNRNSMYVGAY